MSTPEVQLAVLGTTWAESERWEARKSGFLGLRLETVAAPPLRFLDWTIDGQPLRDRIAFADGAPCRDITLLMEGNEGDLFTSESLKALLGESTPGRGPWVQYSDGRAALLFCPQCFGLDCGAVSARVVISESVVEWRDVSYQEGMTEAISTDEIPPFSVRFDRSAYEATVGALLERWGSLPNM